MTYLSKLQGTQYPVLTVTDNGALDVVCTMEANMILIDTGYGIWQITVRRGSNDAEYLWSVWDGVTEPMQGDLRPSIAEAVDAALDWCDARDDEQDEADRQLERIAQRAERRARRRQRGGEAPMTQMPEEA